MQSYFERYFTIEGRFFQAVLFFLGVTCLLVTFAHIPKSFAEEATWRPISEMNMRVLPGSALDFSFLSHDVPITSPVTVKGGHLYHEGKRIRFYGAVMAMQKVFGGIPDHKDADDYANELSIRGYNLVRFVSLQDIFMAGQHKNFDYNQKDLEHWHYFLGALKKRGIFWEIDVLSGDNGGYGTKVRYLRKHSRMLRMRLYYDPRAMKHWEKIVRLLLQEKNPYTGMSTLQDPALAMVTMVNENDLLQSINITQRVDGWLPDEIKDGLNRHFLRWLKLKKPGLFARLSIRQRSLFAHDSNSEVMPYILHFVDLQSQRIHGIMAAYLHSSGFQGLVTGMNSDGNQIASGIPRQQLDVITLHAYHDLPTELGTVNHTLGPKRRYHMQSSTDNHLEYLRRLVVARLKGKPYVVDEYNHAFPNPWRREAALVIPAYAGLHDWDGIARFARPVELAYAHTSAARQHYITAFGTGMDPIARGGESIAALLFLRAEITPSTKVLHLQLNKREWINSGAAWLRWPSSISSVGLVRRMDIEWVEKRNQHIQGSYILTPDDMHAEKKMLWGRLLGDTNRKTTNRRETPTTGIYQADGGKIRVANKQVIVSTANTEAISYVSGTHARLQHIELIHTPTEALLAVSSVDGYSLDESKRMLIVYLTDARNTKMKMNGKTLVEHGHLPVLLRPGSVTFRLHRHQGSCNMALYPLSLRGARREKLNTVSTNRRGGCDIYIALDTNKLKNGTIYFELIDKASKLEAKVASLR